MKTPLRLHGLKTNALGFCTCQIVDADWNSVFSGAIRDKETAERIVAYLNLEDGLYNKIRSARSMAIQTLREYALGGASNGGKLMDALDTLVADLEPTP